MRLHIMCHTPPGAEQAAVFQPFAGKLRFIRWREVSLLTNYR
jgi:hypothetical protein